MPKHPIKLAKGTRGHASYPPGPQVSKRLAGQMTVAPCSAKGITALRQNRGPEPTIAHNPGSKGY